MVQPPRVPPRHSGMNPIRTTLGNLLPQLESIRHGVTPQEPRFIKDGVKPTQTAAPASPKPPGGGSGVPAPPKKT
jgi:hypothetical protein